MKLFVILSSKKYQYPYNGSNKVKPLNWKLHIIAESKDLNKWKYILSLGISQEQFHLWLH